MECKYLLVQLCEKRTESPQCIHSLCFQFGLPVASDLLNSKLKKISFLDIIIKEKDKSELALHHYGRKVITVQLCMCVFCCVYVIHVAENCKFIPYLENLNSLTSRGPRHI